MVKESRITTFLTELIRLAATDLPRDVEGAIRSALEKEEGNSASARALETILENVELAREESVPLCQDTGIPTFYVTLPPDLSPKLMAESIKEAVREATRLSYLRPNVVDALSDKNTGDNVGRDDFPVIEFSYHDHPSLVVDLLLKGGGSENVGVQYTLPNLEIRADRSLDGIRKCALHAVLKAQGLGCPPGIIGVAVGGDRATGYRAAKKALLEKIGEPPANDQVAYLKERVKEEANSMGIGPMGFGGKTALLDVHFTFLHRHPASFFVTVSYSCWALRRKRLIWESREGIFL